MSVTNILVPYVIAGIMFYIAFQGEQAIKDLRDWQLLGFALSVLLAWPVYVIYRILRFLIARY